MKKKALRKKLSLTVKDLSTLSGSEAKNIKGMAAVSVCQCAWTSEVSACISWCGAYMSRCYEIP